MGADWNKAPKPLKARSRGITVETLLILWIQEELREQEGLMSV